MGILSENTDTIYDTIIFNDGDDLFNEPAPEPWVSFLLGAIFSLVGCIYWLLRLQQKRRTLTASGAAFRGKLLLRAMISAFIDSDDAGYVIVKMAAQSFFFLGGLQYDYELTFSVMLGYFAFESCFDSLRILLAFSEVRSLQDLIVTGSNLQSHIRQSLQNPSIVLSPSNVYEDLSRPKSIVLMVFITQCVLIAFVVSLGRVCVCVCVCVFKSHCSKSTLSHASSFPLYKQYIYIHRLWISLIRKLPVAVMAHQVVLLSERWVRGSFMFWVFSWRVCSC